MNDNKKTKILNLKQIASWWLQNLSDNKENSSTVRAVLPPIQRSFVWKPSQVENLWDSIAQGFPIGSLLLSEITDKDNTKQKKGHGSYGNCKDPTHFLLDGQQRATAIAIGFKDIWPDSDNEKDANAVTETLWVDLEPLENDERSFAFYMLTKAHPWGYSRKGNNKLSSSKATEAIICYKKINGGENIRAHELKIFEVFPWDAKAPIPVPLLIKAIMEVNANEDKEKEHNEIIKRLKISLNKTKIWRSLEKHSGIEFTQIQKAKKILDGENSSGLKSLITSLKNSLTNLEIPAPVLSRQNILKENKNHDEYDEHDSTFTLFKRINTAGTTLSREEINYSMLKTLWPDAPDVIEGRLLKDRQMAQPARMVSLMTRLSIMTDKKNQEKTLQAELNIPQFRKFLNKDKGQSFKNFCEDSGWILERVWKLLTQPKEQYALPDFLAAQMSRNSGDLLLLIMYWIYCIGKDEKQWNDVQDKQKKLTLGFLTAILWFSPDIGRCVRRLTKELINLNQNDKSLLIDFFNQERFSIIVQQEENEPVLMIPLPSPDKVTQVLTEKILRESDYRSFKKYPNSVDYHSSDLWHKKASIWHHLADVKTSDTMTKYFCKFLNDKGNTQKANELWWHFFNLIFKDRRFLLYAQREVIDKWFSWYDPTLPDQINDHNRPWDDDHILPYSWAHNGRGVYSEFPNLVRIWLNANGNFRAWPLELNRKKGNKEIIESEENSYQLKDKNMVYKASFINKNNQEKWEKLENKNNEEMWEKDGDKGYKNTFWKPGEHWCIFVEASIERTVDIYSEWYEQLAIGKLMSPEDTK